MKTLNLFLLLFILFPFNSYSLPKCNPNDENWDNCHGTYTYLNGDIYVGEYKNNYMSGKGTYTWGKEWSIEGWVEGSTKYIGEFKEDKLNGKGTITTDSDYIIYKGEFKKGKYHGQGTLTYRNGSKYVGEFKNGQKHGKGTLTKVDYGKDKKYVGQWKNNKYFGNIALSDVDTDSTDKFLYYSPTFQPYETRSKLFSRNYEIFDRTIDKCDCKQIDCIEVGRVDQEYIDHGNKFNNVEIPIEIQLEGFLTTKSGIHPTHGKFESRVLSLERPVCMHGIFIRGEGRIWKTSVIISLFQLASLNDEFWKENKNKKNKVSLSGSMYERYTAWHTTELIMWVTNFGK
tara:strand:- start:218 stop:1246 length:1029 start_codon:yes stop_codon:yes gene_type:complete